MSERIHRDINILPELNQVMYPGLPVIPGNKAVAYITNSPLSDLGYEEITLGVIINACIRTDRIWRPINGMEFSKSLGIYLRSEMRAAVIGEMVFDAIDRLKDRELLELISCTNREYIIPSIELAAMLQQSEITFID